MPLFQLVNVHTRFAPVVFTTVITNKFGMELIGKSQILYHMMHQRSTYTLINLGQC